MLSTNKTIRNLQSTYLSGKIVAILDMIISLAASLLALFGIGLTLNRTVIEAPHWWIYLVSGFVGSVLSFYLLKVYRIIIRHLSVKDLVVFIEASLAKALVILVTLLACGMQSKWSLLVCLLDFFITLFAMLSVRLAMIVAYEAFNRRVQEKFEHQSILVYGTSDKSVATLVRLQDSRHYKIVGFMQRGDGREDKTLDRLPIFSFNDDRKLNKLLLERSIDAVLFARESDARDEEDGVIRFCRSNNIKTLIVPTVDEILEGQSIVRPREINVEDLLGRDEIQISMGEIRDYLGGRVVMVTGAAGSIGSELVRQIAGFGVKKLVLFDNAETPMHNLRLELEDKWPELCFVPIIGDVRQKERLDFAFRTHHPEIVFHAAAYKHVPLMEENPCEAMLVNVYGSRNVADKCLEYGTEKMVMISTDKAVNPTNVMGCTKRLAEIYVQSLGLAVEKGLRPGRTSFVTTRFGNVLGSNGSVIPRFREQIAKGGPVTVTHPDINRFFMTIPEACRLVMEAATLSTGNQIFVFDMGEPVKIDQLARRMIILAGYEPDKDIKIEYTGLRPGEKLYEEVLSSKENTLPAFHRRIRVAKVREYAYDEVLPVMDELERLSRAVEIPDMVRLMKRTVPEYKSMCSKYCEIDKEIEEVAASQK